MEKNEKKEEEGVGMERSSKQGTPLIRTLQNRLMSSENIESPNLFGARCRTLPAELGSCSIFPSHMTLNFCFLSSPNDILIYI